MQCPQCKSTSSRKNGRIHGNQRYRCKDCGRQFIEPTSSQVVPSAEVDSITVSSNRSHTSGAADTVVIPPVEAKITAKELFQALMLPEFIESDAFKTILIKIQQLAQPKPGISILLLDAENLNKFDANLEIFLSKLCNYPLRVKIAFANWKNTVGDTELYERGYQLIHVPTGKNSADAQMIAIGAAICRHYSDAKEVFVCSSDWLLTHLCNELQSQGLTVYRVRKQNNTLAVENRCNGDIKHYSLSLNSEIPHLEGLVKQVEAVIKEETESINNRLTQLSTVAALFQERCQLTINENRPNSVPTEAIAPISTSIDSLEMLINIFIKIIEIMVVDSGLNKVPVNDIKNKFLSEYKENADLIIKQLKPKSSLIKFLRANTDFFKVTLEAGEHYVALVKDFT